MGQRAVTNYPPKYFMFWLIKKLLKFGLLIVILLVAYSFFANQSPSSSSDFWEKNYRIQNGVTYQVDPDSGELYEVTRKFSEGFENANSVDDLIKPNRWHNYNADPKKAGRDDNYYELGNRVTLSHDIVHSGNNSLRFHARPSSDMASKASINKGIMYFKKGDHVYFSGWFYMEDNPDVYDGGGTTFFDLETTFEKYVGLRIIVRTEDALAFELERPKTDLRQAKGEEVSFPTGRWVHVKTHALLSDEEGEVQIWQDGRKVLDRKGRTLPSATSIFDSFEIGITAIARGAKYEKTLYIDDVRISDEPIPN